MRTYANVVERTMSVLGASVSAQWLPRFSDPRILVDDVQRDTLLGDLGAGLDASALFDAARDALVQSVHIGTMLTAVAALVAALLVRHISHIVFRKVGTAGAKPERRHRVQVIRLSAACGHPASADPARVLRQRIFPHSPARVSRTSHRLLARAATTVRIGPARALADP